MLRHLELFGAHLKLTLIHVVDDYAFTAMASTAGIGQPVLSEREFRTLQTKAFEDALGPARGLLNEKAGVAAHEVRLVGNAGDQLSAYARKNLDLLVLGTHGYGAFKAATMGSVATRVTARSRLPLLLVRA